MALEPGQLAEVYAGAPVSVKEPGMPESLVARPMAEFELPKVEAE